MNFIRTFSKTRSGLEREALKDGRLFNFAVSPDYKQIVFAHGSQFNEAILIENFGKQ